LDWRRHNGSSPKGVFVYVFARHQDELDRTVTSIGRNIAGVDLPVDGGMTAI
jgi:hypothetical protein